MAAQSLMRMVHVVRGDPFEVSSPSYDWMFFRYISGDFTYGAVVVAAVPLVKPGLEIRRTLGHGFCQAKNHVLTKYFFGGINALWELENC